MYINTHHITKHTTLRISCVVGGEERLADFLDHVDPFTQEDILAQLEKHNPPLAQKLKERIVTLDTLPKFGSLTLTRIARNTDAYKLASVLREVKPEFQEEFLSKLPTGMQAILREEIALARPLPPARYNERVRQLLEIARRMKFQEEMEG